MANGRRCGRTNWYPGGESPGNPGRLETTYCSFIDPRRIRQKPVHHSKTLPSNAWPRRSDSCRAVRQSRVSFWDHRFTAFAFGFCGGLAVNLFRLYLLSQSPETERPEFDWIYWTQFAGLAIMGAIAALAHDLSN